MENTILNSKSYREVAIKEFGYANSYSYKKIKKFILVNNIDINHFISNPQNVNRIKYPKITKSCPIRGHEFETKKGHKKEKTVCSRSCSNTYFRTGKDNPNYKKDTDLNGAASYRIICFRYHEKKCVCCDENLIVEVHHYDGNKNNNKPENLIPLCPTHHTYWHSKFRYKIRNNVDEYVKKFKLKNNIG